MTRARLVIVALAAVAAIAPLPPQTIEHWYSNAFYAWLQPFVTKVSSPPPVALLDLAALALVMAAMIHLRRLWHTSASGEWLRRTALSAIFTVAVLYLWFLLFWGLNYRRMPLEEKLAYDPSRVTRARALEVGQLAVRQVNELAAQARTPGLDGDALARSLAEVQQLLGATRVARTAPPKRSLLTWYFRKAGIDGMTDPFFLEIIVNPEVLPFERPFTLAHEWAHLAGYADESEAGFVAWLACIRGTPDARYSGWLSAYEHIAGALPRDERKALRDALSPLVVADLLAVNQRFARANPRISAAARNVYDTYLRANRIEEGIASYGMVVRLMLGTTFDANWTPQLRH